MVIFWLPSILVGLISAWETHATMAPVEGELDPSRYTAANSAISDVMKASARRNIITLMMFECNHFLKVGGEWYGTKRWWGKAEEEGDMGSTL